MRKVWNKIVEHKVGIVQENHFITILFAVIAALWFILIGVGGYCLKRISSKLDALIVHRMDCMTSFADAKKNAADHAVFYAFKEHAEMRLTKLECERGRKNE